MDSMRSLNSSLPSSRPNNATPPDLLQAFRTAALSVTNLYKSAAADQANARQEGYQDALEDLLKFLDSENLGLQDGEGWKVRQWATQKYDGGSYQQKSEADEEQSEPETTTHSVYAVQTQEETTSGPAANLDSNNDSDHDTTEHEDNPRSMFHFTGLESSEQSMQTDEQAEPQLTSEASSSLSGLSRSGSSARTNRISARPSNGRRSTRSTRGDFTFTAGTKRRIDFPDFFDISNLNDKRNGPSGSGNKRGRFV